MRAARRDDREGAFEFGRDAHDLVVEDAFLGDRLDADHQEVVALSGLLRDGLLDRVGLRPRCDVDRRRRLGFEGVGLGARGGRLGQRLRFFCAAGTQPRLTRQDRRRDAGRPGQEADQPRGEPAARAVVDRDQESLHVGDEALRLERLAFEPRLLLRPHRQPRQGPAQHRGHRHRRHDGHRQDHREQALAEGAGRQADRRDDDLGRATRIHAPAKRQAFAPGQPADGAAEKRAAELADAGDCDQQPRQDQHRRIGQHVEIGAEPSHAEKHRHEQRDDQAAQLLVDMAGQDRRLADQHAGDKGAEHGMDADRMGDQRHDAHHDQDRRDHRHLADQIVVGPADQQRHRAAADREAGGEKQQRAEDALPERGKIDMAVAGEPEDHGDDDPADRVVDDRRGDDDLAEGAAHEVQFAHRHRDDLDRRDRQRGAEKQRRHQPLVGVGQHLVGQQLAEDDAARERQADAGERDAERGGPVLGHQGQVGFHPGQQQQHQDAELRDGIDHALLLVRRRKDRVLQLRPQRAQDARAEQHAGDQLAHDGRLTDALHGFAQQAPANEKQDDLGQEHHLGRRVRRTLGGERDGDQDQQGGEQQAADHPSPNP